MGSLVCSATRAPVTVTLPATMQLLVLSLLLAGATAIPTLYKVDSDKKTAERGMVAVSSTVIPLEDLPETEVGFGFGFAKGPPVKKPAYLKDIKLITSKNKHRFVAPAGVKQLTKKEWEAFSNSVSSK